MRSRPAEGPTEGRAIVAISDLHVEVAENRRFVEQIRPRERGDWLIVCGDVGDFMADIEWGLGVLAERFEKVIWVPGNHELWTHPDDPAQQRGEERYQHLVARCRGLGVVTPEDPYPVWPGPDGPVVVAPLFTLYDYSFRLNGLSSKREALASAYEAGVVCSDEFILFPDPYPSIEEWCAARVRVSAERLADATADGLPSVLISHFPLLLSPTRQLVHPEFAQWCGTVMTADWHRRFSALAVVYGHLHIPRTTVHDSVRFEEVSLGYPRQWGRRSSAPALRQILPVAGRT